MRKVLRIYFIAALMIISAASSYGQIRITEAMSSAGGTGIGAVDWFELTNLGSAAVDITGWKMDDAAANPISTLSGLTSIPAGKSVIFLNNTDIAAFKSFWGSSLDNVEIGTYIDNGLSSSGDGVVILDANSTEISRVSFGAATAGKSFYWSYKSDGTVVDNAVVSSVGTITGTVSNQVTITSANVLGNIGSPGTAIVLPLSANTINPSMKPWRLEGHTLKFDVLATQNVDLYSLTGMKVSTNKPAGEIKLDMKQGIYILKVDGKSTKITIR